ncbi:MAG TPA: hypothetical protein VHE80_11155 [Acidimicrobiales bacterium]|nr:hypothetical protein [Acidimicrobiales bacterium]
MSAPFVLVHSPLMGPVVWSWVAEELEERGNAVIVPSLATADLSQGWPGAVDSVVDGTRTAERAILVGHSGAGPLLPVIAARMASPPQRQVFVDASVPPEHGDARLVPEEHLGSLRALAGEGLLPRWSDWFGPGVMEMLVPEVERRAAVLADLPEVPLAFFETPVPMPDGWSASGCTYVLLSELYRSDATTASSRGWPVVEMVGGHLDLVTRPSEVAEALLPAAEP